MSLADRLKKMNQEREVSGKHPLLAMSLPRDVRDAYFRGVALAACVDDGKVDDAENAYLHRLGCSLKLSDGETNDLISSVAECKSEDEQLSLFDEIADKIAQPMVAKLFLIEFSLVWKSHASKSDELAVYRTEIAKRIGLLIPDGFWTDFDSIFADPNEAARQSRRIDGFGPEIMSYLFPAYGQIKESKDTTPDQSQKSEFGLPDFSSFFGGLFRPADERGNNRDISCDSVHIRVVSSLCTGCGACLSYCPQSAIDVIGDNFSINSQRCTHCGTCIPKCPTGAIVRGESTEEGYFVVLRSCGPNVNSIAEVVKEITGMNGSDAMSIATSGGRCLMTKLSYEKARQYQRRLQSLGASADVIKD